MFACVPTTVSGGQGPGVREGSRSACSLVLRGAMPQDVRRERPGVVRLGLQTRVAVPQRQDTSEDPHPGLRLISPAG